MENFQAFLLENKNEEIVSGVTTLPKDFLPEEDLLVKVSYSSLNYKDFLASQKKGGVVRSYPMIPGIDLTGVVVKSNTPEFQVGDQVLATSYAIGVTHFGGLSQYASLKKEWVLPLPKNLTPQKAMALGTAGFTAGLALHALKQAGLTKESTVAITGATGGVGSLASLLLAKMGVENVTLISQKPSVKNLPHKNFLATAEFLEASKKPLQKQTYDFAIDAVGGQILSQLLTQISYGGSVAALGNAGGISLETTVLPFILRGVSLLGIDSVSTPMPLRKKIWEELAQLNPELPAAFQEEISLSEVPEVFSAFKNGTHVGRTLVKM